MAEECAEGQSAANEMVMRDLDGTIEDLRAGGGELRSMRYFGYDSVVGTHRHAKMSIWSIQRSRCVAETWPCCRETVRILLIYWAYYQWLRSAQITFEGDNVAD